MEIIKEAMKEEGEAMKQKRMRKGERIYARGIRCGTYQCGRTGSQRWHTDETVPSEDRAKGINEANIRV